MRSAGRGLRSVSACLATLIVESPDRRVWEEGVPGIMFSSGRRGQARCRDGANRRFNQFDSSRTGQLNSFDLQRLLAKDETIEAREDCVKMVSYTASTSDLIRTLTAS